MKKLTDEQWWDISNYTAQPIPLREIDNAIPFLYVRGWGVFYVQMGCHQVLAAQICCWIYECEDVLDLAEKGIINGLDAHAEANEHLINNYGTAWLSNVGNPVIYFSNLNHAEMTYISPNVKA